MMSQIVPSFNQSQLDGFDICERQSDSKSNQYSDDLHVSDKKCSPLKVGDRAPNIKVPNGEGEMIDLVELSPNGSVILIFHRGQWCPYDSLDVFELQKSLVKHMMLDTPIVVISPHPDSIEYLCPHQTKRSLRVLNDVNYGIARTFGLVCALSPKLEPVYERLSIDILSVNNGDRFESFIPAVYLIDHSCIVRKAYVDSSYIGKFSTHRCLMALDEDYWLALV